MNRRPPKVTDKTPIGKDVDLDEEAVHTKAGKRVTRKSVDRLVAEARKPGRPSLAGSGTAPTVAFRVPPELRERAEQLAAKEGKSVSALAREALEARVKAG